mmetsp:Transcript_39503/g.113638  ORF Transcript_39503/g.113638 Transcript_39503/m.113638 type:complete len:530 (-) Transcript_39503:103-1692(-)
MSEAADYDSVGPRVEGRRGWSSQGLTQEGAIFASRAQRFAPYLVEALGTFILTLTFASNYRSTTSRLWAITSNGMMLIALTYAFGHISGANLNPGISLSLVMAGRQKGSIAWRMCLAQMIGAAAGAVVLLELGLSKTVNLGPADGYTWCSVFAIELLYSAVMCFAFLNCAASTRNNPWHAPNGFIGLAVGFTFVAGGYAAHRVAPVVMNSALAVGLTFFDGQGWASNVSYIVADFLGAFVAAGAYRLVRPVEAERPDEAVTVVRSSGARPPPGRVASEKRSRQRDVDGDAARVAAEFFGTFVIIFTKALNRLGATVDIGPEAWSVAAALISMVYSLRGVSGAYFNPAVTLGAMLSGRTNLSVRTATFYVVAQVFAGIAAMSLYTAISHGEPITLQFGRRHPATAELYAESCFTFLLTYVVLAMSVPSHEAAGLPDDGLVRRQSDIAGFAYGACQIAGGFAVGHISGALLNPAVVIAFEGINVFHSYFRGRVMLYIFWETFGAILGAGTFMLTNAHLYLEKEEGVRDVTA